MICSNKSKLSLIAFAAILVFSASGRFQAQEAEPHRTVNPAAQLLRFDSLEELDKALQKEVAGNRFSGVVLIAERGVTVFQKAYGFAQKGERVPNRLDTKFDIGSITKDFTSVAVLQLAEKGLLKLDDSIGKYLSGFRPRVASRITIRHLLQHRSGWGEYWGSEEYKKTWRDLRSIGSYLGIIRKLPLSFEPGAREQYSNVGFVVLGAIIEKASGQSYYDYLSKNIFLPLEMRDTGFYEKDMPVENRAVGYTNQSLWGPRTGFERENSYIEFPRGNPSGGAYSTTGDLLKFFDAFFNDRILSKRYTDFMFRGYKESKEPLDRSAIKGATAGGDLGVSSFAYFGASPTIIVLSNYDEPIAEVIGEQIVKALPRLVTKQS